MDLHQISKWKIKNSSHDFVHLELKDDQFGKVWYPNYKPLCPLRQNEKKKSFMFLHSIIKTDDHDKKLPDLIAFYNAASMMGIFMIRCAENIPLNPFLDNNL